MLHRSFLSSILIGAILLASLPAGAEPPASSPRVVAPPSGAVMPALDPPVPAPPSGSLPGLSAAPRAPSSERKADAEPPLVYNQKRGNFILAGVLCVALGGLFASAMGVGLATRKCDPYGSCPSAAPFVAGLLIMSGVTVGGIPLVIAGTRLPPLIPKEPSKVSLGIGLGSFAIQGTF